MVVVLVATRQTFDVSMLSRARLLPLYQVWQRFTQIVVITEHLLRIGIARHCDVMHLRIATTAASDELLLLFDDVFVAAVDRAFNAAIHSCLAQLQLMVLQSRLTRPSLLLSPPNFRRLLQVRKEEGVAVRIRHVT